MNRNFLIGIQKKYFQLSICLLVVMLHATVSAQSTKFKSEWNIGLSAGTTFSSVDFIPRISTKPLQGNIYGLGVRYISENHLGLITEINYSQQGWEQDFSNISKESVYAYSRIINYVEVPVMTHIYFGRKARFFFNLGPKVSFKLSEKENLNDKLSELIASKDSTILRIKDQYGKKVEKDFDYGLVVGTGMELRTKIGNFMLEGRYYLGLNDIFNSRKSDYFSRSAHRVISAKLTYFIRPF